MQTGKRFSCPIYDLETKVKFSTLCFNKIENTAGERTSNYYAKENIGEETNF